MIFRKLVFRLSPRLSEVSSARGVPVRRRSLRICFCVLAWAACFFARSDSYLATSYGFFGTPDPLSNQLSFPDFRSAASFSLQYLPVVINGGFLFVSDTFLPAVVSSNQTWRIHDLPHFNEVHNLINDLYRSGFTNGLHFAANPSRLEFFSPRSYILSALFGTNDVFRSTVITRLDSISSFLAEASTNLMWVAQNSGIIAYNTHGIDSNVRSLRDDYRQATPFANFDNAYGLLRTLGDLNGIESNDPQVIYDALGYIGDYTSADMSSLNSRLVLDRTKAAQAAYLTNGGSTNYVSDSGFSFSYGDLMRGSPQTLNDFYQYAYNTPTTNQQHKMLGDWGDDWLGKLDKKMEDSQLSKDVADIAKNTVGPKEVMVMNWPDQLSWVNSLSNALADVLNSLSFNPEINLTNRWTVSGDQFSVGPVSLRWWGLLHDNRASPPDVNSFVNELYVGFGGYSFDLTGDFFDDVPNMILAQSVAGADRNNLLSRILLSSLTNQNFLASIATNSIDEAAEVSRYESIGDEIENALTSSFAHSNDVAHIHFLDVSRHLVVPGAFNDFSDARLPEFVSFQFPSWSFGQFEFGHQTLSIRVSDYADYFNFLRGLFRFVYWAFFVVFVLFIFSVFVKLVWQIPEKLSTSNWVS